MRDSRFYVDTHLPVGIPVVQALITLLDRPLLVRCKNTGAETARNLKGGLLITLADGFPNLLRLASGGHFRPLLGGRTPPNTLRCYVR